MYAFPEPFDTVSIAWFRRRPSIPSRLPPKHARQGNPKMMTKSPIALIALASSTALAQQGPGDGNIPAPNLFDSQIQCTSRLPSMAPTPTLVATGDMESLLDTVIGMGDVRITDDRCAGRPGLRGSARRQQLRPGWHRERVSWPPPRAPSPPMSPRVTATCCRNSR